MHTANDRITSQIRTIMENIYAEIKLRIAKGSFVDPNPILIPFVSMMPLRAEVSSFLTQYRLPDELLSMDN